jgi:ATPase components of various ABC-type transport systems, contain duplicated ATPase
MSEPQAAISVRDVTRNYLRSRTSLFRAAPSVHALHRVSFDVQPGERFGIVGESGCGKPYSGRTGPADKWRRAN